MSALIKRGGAVTVPAFYPSISLHGIPTGCLPYCLPHCPHVASVLGARELPPAVLTSSSPESLPPCCTCMWICHMQANCLLPHGLPPPVPTGTTPSHSSFTPCLLGTKGMLLVRAQTGGGGACSPGQPNTRLGVGWTPAHAQL